MSLASIPSPATAVWHIGPLPVRAYSICILLGIVAAAIVTDVRLRRRGAPPWTILDIALWAVPFGIVGARIYHLITSPDAYFGKDGDPMAAFQIWNGGLGIWGAVAGGAVGAWIACKRLDIPLTMVADAMAPGLPVGQAIGRVGNWFNNELYGRLTTLPWGLKVHDMDASAGRAETGPDGQPLLRPGTYHPAFLYELVWDLGVALLVWAADRRYRFGKGRAFALYVMAYTVGRFWIEMLRIDDAHGFLGLRVNSWISILVFAGALYYFLRVRGEREVLVPDAGGALRAVPESAAGTAGTGTPGTDAPTDLTRPAASGDPADSVGGDPADSVGSDPADSVGGDPADNAVGDTGDGTAGQPSDGSAEDPGDGAAGTEADGAAGDTAGSSAGGTASMAAGDTAGRAPGDTAGSSAGGTANRAAGDTSATER